MNVIKIPKQESTFAVICAVIIIYVIGVGFIPPTVEQPEFKEGAKLIRIEVNGANKIIETDKAISFCTTNGGPLTVNYIYQ